MSANIHEFDNGITLLGEKIDSVQSAAFSALIPFGAATDPIGLEGSANILMAMLSKGAGGLKAKELSQKFEEIGLHKSQNSGIQICSVAGSLLSENLSSAIDLFYSLITEADLPEEELDSVRMLCLQELKSLEEEPSSKVMVELAKNFYPKPFSCSQYGTKKGLNSVTIETLQDYYNKSVVSDGMIVGVAGNYEWDEVVKVFSKTFGTIKGKREKIEVEKLEKEIGDSISSPK